MKLARAALAFGLAAGLCGFSADRTPRILERSAGKLPPDYREKIIAWSKRYFAEPGSVRFLAITDPVPVRVAGGAELWLVCVEVEARERSGATMSPQKVAIGLGAGLFSAPLERSGILLRNDDCGLPLRWQGWRPAQASRRR